MMPGGGKSPDDCVAVVNAWIGRQGFALEHKASTMLATAGFKVWHGHHVYSHADAENALEIDVLASAELPDFNLSVVVECKYAPEDKAWVLFESETSPDIIDGIGYTGEAGELLDLDQFRQEAKALLREVAGAALPSYALRLAGPKDSPDRDPAFKSVQGIVARSIGRREHLAEQQTASREVVVPIVLLSGRLTSARWNGDAFDVVKRDSGLLIWRGHGKWSRAQDFATVFVTTEAAFPTLATNLFAAAKKLAALAIDPGAHLLKAETEKRARESEALREHNRRSLNSMLGR